MEKDIFLANLKKFLKSVVCEKIYAEASTQAKEAMESDIAEFIDEIGRAYSTPGLKDTFTSAQATIGVFMDYRDAKIPNRSQKWCEPVTGMLFVWVPGGSFQMGCGDWDSEGLDDEKPVHEVWLDSFWIGKFAVTVAQYMKFVKDTGSYYPHWLEKGSKYNIATGGDDLYKKLGRALIGETYPIIGVSWHDAVAFSEWLSSKSEYTFSLPTEAQWEYAARSGGKHEKYAGGYSADQVAWYDDNSGGTPHPVGTKVPNGLGLHNMCGNVSEWCQDIYGRFAYGEHRRHNPVYLGKGMCRVVRGGSYNYGPRDVRCTDRSLFVPEVRTNDLGFRLVRKP